MYISLFISAQELGCEVYLHSELHLCGPARGSSDGELSAPYNKLEFE
jgi:hypothetical protein